MSEHFSLNELRCKCCHNIIIVPELIQKLEALRAAVGKPIHVNCAYRCPEHNAEVGGVANSFHTRGMAADIWIEGMTSSDVAKVAVQVGFRGIGLYDTFTHVDVRPNIAHWDNRTTRNS